MEIGDTILHAKYGVGIIESIEKRLSDGVKRDYFVIPKPSISSTIFVPVDAAGELGLRLLSTTEKLKQAVSILSGEADDTNPCNDEHVLNWSDPIDLAYAIRCGVVEPQQRYPNTSQQNQLKHAKKLVAEELTVVLGMSDEKINELVEKKSKRK